MENENIYANLAGVTSIVCWVTVFTPQIYENFKNKQGDSLSLTFLWIWLIGDIFNIIGVAMEKLLATMLILGIYYAIADLVLIGQVYYYRKKSSVSSLSIQSDISETTSLLHNSQGEQLQATSRFYNKLSILDTSLIGFSIIIFILCSIITVKILNCSQYLGWLSAILYIVSRIPQIIKNFKLRTTEGLSIAMFSFAVAGNIFFCLSIFLQATEYSYIIQNLPWLVGACGTLFFDILVLFQFFLFRDL